jgi:hypothetical protein
MVQIHKYIIAFLSAWLEWVDAGAPPHPIFNRGNALCQTLFIYAETNNLDRTRLKYTSRLLGTMFLNDGLSPAMPFNPVIRSFWEERESGTCHENQSRVRWVREKLAQTGDQNG